MTIHLILDGIPATITILARRPALTCRVGDQIWTVAETAAADAGTVVTIDGEAFHLWRVQEGDRVHIKLGTRTFSLAVDDPINAAAQLGGSSNAVRADMPGVVVGVNCAAGDVVRAGHPLLTIESMKMQMTLTAPRDGTIGTVAVKVNESFQKGAVLVVMAAELEATPS
ncbi:MAG: acetyl-CoA carboxylase biotin carboxyl carrier protein subunit [Gammaproteobacteria bacterium]|nr:acetyl-CoA carboxylase biotin carboxyl carrier protein subunit [Gammaproteobacteria bacterium]